MPSHLQTELQTLATECWGEDIKNQLDPALLEVGKALDLLRLGTTESFLKNVFDLLSQGDDSRRVEIEWRLRMAFSRDIFEALGLPMPPDFPYFDRVAEGREMRRIFHQ